MKTARNFKSWTPSTFQIVIEDAKWLQADRDQISNSHFRRIKTQYVWLHQAEIKFVLTILLEKNKTPPCSSDLIYAKQQVNEKGTALGVSI